MQAWTYVWAAVLAFGLAIFVGLAVVVTIGGWGDIRALFRTLPGLWDYMAITGAIYFCGAFAVLAAGIYWRKASRIGAYLALGSGFFALIGLGPLQKPLRIAMPGMTAGLLTAALTIGLMIVGSLLFPDRARQTDTEE